MNGRTGSILSLLSERGKMNVSELADTLGVSQVTVRKDLDALECRGIIKREHGFAVLSGENNTASRLAYHYEEKRSIARCAAALVQDGSAVIIENGSCCACLAQVLAEEKKNLTIITNSAFIASGLRSRQDFQIILLGGIFQQDSEVNVGPMVRQCVENFNVEMMFIGVDGYSRGRGFTNRDSLRAQAVRDMSVSAEKIIVLTESEKFHQPGNVCLKCGSRVSSVITDGGIDPEIKSELERSGVQVLISD